MWTVIGGVWNFIESVGTISEYARQVGSYVSIDDRIETLKRKCEDLRFRAEDVKAELGNAESSSGEKRRKTVENWLTNVQKLRNQVDAALSQTRILERPQLAKKVENLSELAERFLEQGKFPQGLTLYTPHDGGVDLLTKPLVGKAFQENLEKIWRYLIEPEVLTIGIWGMGGVGKTTLATHIHNRVRECHGIFNDVFWVTVSQNENLDIHKLQDEFAKAIHLQLNNEQDERKRAAMLSNELKKNRCLFILDDVWHHIDLDRVGIPVQVNGCKLIITTRSLDVCRRLVCEKKIKVEPLSEEEAWDLFKKNLGCGEALSPEVMEIAFCVARECAGLPLGIITVARCLREVNDASEWRDALRALKDSKADGLVEMEDEVFRVLKFSYSRLRDPKGQQSFLYCAMYPEDHKIEREDLIQRLIDEGIIEGMESRQAQFDKGHVILTKLVNSCLLEKVVESCMTEIFPMECVKMHDLVRDMAIKMSPQFMVKAGIQLGCLPWWPKDVERVSLMNCSIVKGAVDARTSTRSQKLSTLLLSGNYYLTRIENSFFQKMSALQSLDLTGCMSIQELPGSVSILKNLSALVLSGCMQLKGVPSLAKLKSLKRLDLHGTSIRKVPEGLERLVNLTYLDLDAKLLMVFPDGILPQLLLLEFLKFDDGGVTIKGEELGMLERLSTFKGKLIFNDVNGFKSYVMSRHPYRGPNCSYRFALDGTGESVSEEYRRCDNLNSITLKGFNFSKKGVEANVDVGTLEALLKDAQSLELDTCYDIQKLCGVPCLNNTMNNLKRCKLDSCSGINCLVPSSGSSPLFLQNLEKLELRELRDLEVLLESGRGENVIPSSPVDALGGAFSVLKVLQLLSCSKIKVLFHPAFLPNLRNLQEIWVNNCYRLEEIVAAYDSGRERSTSIELALPNLTTLSLIHLPQLTRICRQTIACPSLSEITVADCPQLKRMPLSKLPSSLQSITVHPKEWFESATWNRPYDKYRLRPSLKDFHPSERDEWGEQF